MTKELLQQTLNEARSTAITVFTHVDGIAQETKDAIEYMYSLLGTHFERQALAQQEPDDYASAKRLAETIYRKHYRTDAPHWEPLPDLAGVLSQIDNMVSGLAKAQQEPNPWREAVIDQLVVHHIYQAAHDTDPRLALHHLLGMSNQIALDPLVSSDAQALIDRGRKEAEKEQPAQPASEEDMKIYKSIADGYLSSVAQQEQPAKTELQIRRMFCATYASDSSPYMDDGEAQDNSMIPCIDFLRDSPEQIQSKMMERAIAKHKAQQEQPASVDAYNGAREDVAIWKKRALEAEELNRKFIADVNGPTYLGEPVKQEQPAQEPVAWLHGTTFQVVVSKNRPNSLAAWLPLFAHPAPTQPALSDEQILDIFHKVSADGIGHYMTAVGRAIEAHCRGGVNHG